MSSPTKERIEAIRENHNCVPFGEKCDTCELLSAIAALRNENEGLRESALRINDQLKLLKRKFLIAKREITDPDILDRIRRVQS